MKVRAILAVTPILLAVSGVAAAQSACPCGAGTLISSAADIATHVGGKTVCASDHSIPALAPWQEFHSGVTAAGGALTAYRNGPTDPVDPSRVVGSWSASGTLSSSRVIYNYGSGGTYQYAVCQNGGLTNFCGAMYGGKNILGAQVKAGSGAVCGFPPAPTFEIWGWTESHVERDFIADGGDWEALGLGIDAGDVVLDTTCSAERISCQKGVNCPPEAPAGTGIAGPLNVAVRTQDGYLLSEVHMDAEESPSAIPQTGGGNPKVGLFETKANWDVLSPASGWSSDTDDDLSDGNTSYIALHGKVFVPNGCTVKQGDSYYALCSRTGFETDVEACEYELENCSGEGAWADGNQFNEGQPKNWAMYMEVKASDFCSFEKVCDSLDGTTCP